MIGKEGPQTDNMNSVSQSVEIVKRDEWSLLRAIGIHLTLTLNPNPNTIGSYMVYMWNNRRNVFLWRPVNSTLPSKKILKNKNKDDCE